MASTTKRQRHDGRRRIVMLCRKCRVRPRRAPRAHYCVKCARLVQLVSKRKWWGRHK